MRTFITSLFVAAAVATNHDGEEVSAISAGSNGYGLNVWAVTGKLNFESQNIDTWYFGLELTTPLGNPVLSSDAKAKDLGTDGALTYVGNNGNVYQTYVQFDNPNDSSSNDFESFSCSRILSVMTEAKEFSVENEKGYPESVYENVTTESIGEAEVQNYLGSRSLNETGNTNNNAYNNQLINYSNQYPNNQVDTGLWYAESEINSTVFLQQGYKQGTGTRKYNCVAQRSMEDSRSVIPSLIPKTTELTFYAGYRIYDSATATVSDNHNVRSSQLSITVMDSAVAMTATAVVAATAMLAF